MVTLLIPGVKEFFDSRKGVLLLFDQQFIDRLPPLNNYHNSQVVMLCRAPHLEKLRQQVENWFSQVSIDRKSDLRARLQSKRDDQHLGAFYELVLYRYCLGEGWKTELSPTLDNGLTPDLQVETSKGTRFLLEVYTLMDSEGYRRQQKTIVAIRRAFNQIKTPFLLNLTFHDYPSNQVSIPRIATAVRDWLSRLDPQSGDQEQDFADFGVPLKITAMIREGTSEMQAGKVFAIIGPPQSGLPELDRLTEKLSEKRQKYSSKRTNLPLVIAACDGTSRPWWGHERLDIALYGQKVVTFPVAPGATDAATMSRDHSGMVTPKNTSDGYFPRHTGISAVLQCTKVPENDGTVDYQMSVFHNPWAAIPLSDEVFGDLPQLQVKRNDETGVTLEWNRENRESFRVKLL